MLIQRKNQFYCKKLHFLRKQINKPFNNTNKNTNRNINTYKKRTLSFFIRLNLFLLYGINIQLNYIKSAQLSIIHIIYIQNFNSY